MPLFLEEYTYMIFASAVNMRQKLITLCPNSWEIASKKPNFSKWVRRQLLDGDRTQQDLDMEMLNSAHWKELAYSLGEKYEALKKEMKA
jgi:hypothetical protein